MPEKGTDAWGYPLLNFPKPCIGSLRLELLRAEAKESVNQSWSLTDD